MERESDEREAYREAEEGKPDDGMIEWERIEYDKEGMMTTIGRSRRREAWERREEERRSLESSGVRGGVN